MGRNDQFLQYLELNNQAGGAGGALANAINDAYAGVVDYGRGVLSNANAPAPYTDRTQQYADQFKRDLVNKFYQPENAQQAMLDEGVVNQPPRLTIPVGSPTGGAQTDQQRKMLPFSLTKPTPPNNKIGLYEGAIRVGGEMLKGSQLGGLNAMGAGANMYGKIEDYNRAQEMQQYKTEMDSYNKGLKALLDAQKGKKGQGGVDGTALLGSIVVNDAVGRALPLINGLTAGFGGEFLSKIPGTDAKDLMRLLDTVKANAGFDKLNAMRQASPTGGALGQVSDREIRFLQAVFGSLDQDQSPDNLRRSLQAFQWTYNTMIHGYGGHEYPVPAGMNIQPLLDAMYTRKGLPIPEVGTAVNAPDAQLQASLDYYANL